MRNNIFNISWAVMIIRAKAFNICLAIKSRFIKRQINFHFRKITRCPYKVEDEVGEERKRGEGGIELRHYIMDNGIVRKYGRRMGSSIANCQNPRVMPGSESRSERRLSRRLRARGRVYREVVADCVHYGGLPCTHQPATTYRHRSGNVSAQRRLAHTEHRCYK